MSDTITAIATPLGEGGIGVVRIGGDDALKIMRSVFKECPEDVVPRHVYFGHAVNSDGEIIDEAVFLYMKGPASYTGEDMVEVQAHGSNVSLRNIVRAAIEQGARMAEPGEFTKLAFLNGKLDLSQAEAVIDIIKARTDMTLEIAEKQKEGRLSETIESIRDSLVDILAQMAVNIDYPDEDIEEAEYEEHIDSLRWTLNSVEELISTASIGRIAREGIKIAIVGKPNVGKSSLMNAILGEGRVIVTDIPGTTRDTVEESANIDGVPVVLIDTAGIRDTDDTIEQIGIKRTERAIASSDMIMLVIDGSRDLEDEDDEIISYVKHIDGERILVVINKDDLGDNVDEQDIQDKIPGCSVLRTSLVDGNAVNAAAKVSSVISNKFDFKNIMRTESQIITSERQLSLLKKAASDIEEAINQLDSGEAIELAEINVHSAYDNLGEIIGESAGDEILDTVFSKFCLGK